MKCKQTKQFFLIVFLLFSLFIQTSLFHVKAESPLVNVANAKLYLPIGTSIGFQHPTAKIVLTVNSGTLNGSATSLTMYSATGTLKFSSHNNAAIFLTSTNYNTTFHINGIPEDSTSILNGQNYVVEWTLTTSLLPPIFFTSGQTYYFINGIHTTNNITGYGISTSSGFASTYATQNLGTVNGTVQWGFMAYLVNSHGVATCLSGTDKVAVMERVGVGSGYQTNTVAVSARNMNLGYGSIEVIMYVRLGSGSWILMATFTTERLMVKGLTSSVWNFTMWTQKSLVGSNIMAYAYWGDQAHKSSLSGLSFVEPLTQEIALWKAQNGDLIGAVLYPFMLYTGDLIYGLGLMFVGGVLYLRHKKWETILIILVIFGSGAGIGFLIPSITYRLIYIIIWFILAIVLYKVFR